MCMGSTPDAPTPPPIAPEAAQMPSVVNRSGSYSDKRRRAAAGMSSTILTGSRGTTTQGVTATKTLLGQ